MMSLANIMNELFKNELGLMSIRFLTTTKPLKKSL